MRMQFRRRKEGKTNYLKRKNILKSNVPRVVFRKTNKHVIAQYVTSSEARDSVELSVNSKELLKYGWPEEKSGSLKSLSASYLTGFLMGKKIIKEKKQKPVLDFGMITPVHKTRPFAFLKGLLDAGVAMVHKGKDIFPDEKRIMGAHMKEDFSGNFKKIKSEIEKL